MKSPQEKNNESGNQETMKKIAASIIFILATAFIAVAQSPAPPPSTAAVPAAATPSGLQPNSQVVAALYAGQIITQINGVVGGVVQVLDNGVPAQNGQPAVTAKDIQAALGPENVMKLRALAGTLSAQSAPAPAPTPKK